MTLSRNDFAFLISNAILLTFCVTTLYWHMNLRIERSSKVEAVGVLTFKRFEVLRKYQERVVWEDIEAQSEVYPMDSILTKDHSDAKLELNNGVVFELAPNSMVVIENFKNKTALKLRSGKVNTASQSSSESAFVLTELGQAIDISNAEASMTISDEGALSMAVNAGAVMIETQSGEKQEVEQGENVSIDKESNIEIQKMNVNTVEPSDGMVTVIAGDTVNVPLKWSSSETIPNAKLTLSNDASLKRPKELNVAGKESVVIAANPGVYYWKVSGADANREFSSSVSAFNIIKDSPPLLISPQENEKIDYLSELPLVTLNWRNSKLCDMSRVKVSNSADFNGSYSQNIVTPMMSLNVKAPAAGKYFWSVECNYGQAGVVNVIKYPVRTFTVVKIDKAPPPVLITPNGAELYEESVTKGDAKLSWNAVREADKYQVNIYRDREKKELVTTITTNKNVFSLPENLGLDRFYWTVTGVMETGDKTEESKVSYVNVVPIEEIALVDPAPGHVAGVYVDTQMKQSLRFSWKRLNGNFQYKLEIASDSGFNDIVRTLKTSTNSIGLRDFPDSGDYYWRVVAFDYTDSSFEKKLTESKVRQFELKKALKTPELEYPRTNVKLEGQDLVDMKFRWSEVPGANRYSFKIYHKKADSAEVLISEVLTRNYYYLRNLSKFNDGTYIWEVSPQYIDSGSVQLSGQSAFATMIVTGLTLPKPEILPGKPDIILSIQ